MKANRTNAMKLAASLSKRVPTRLHSLSHPTQRSTTLLRLYTRRSSPRSPSRAIWSLRYGMTASTHRRASHRRTLG